MQKALSLSALVASLLLVAGCAATPQASESAAPPEPAATGSTIPEESPEPNPSASNAEPTPETTPKAEATEPAAAPVEQQVIVPVPTFDEVKVDMTPGETFVVVGEGYEPDERVSVSFGFAQSDALIVSIDLTTDGSGRYEAPIRLNDDIAPGSYGIMTMPTPMRGMPIQEEAKRWASIEVIAQR